MKKTFVLDTNVLLHNSACIESFEDNDVVLPISVIEELDTFKKQSDELGRNARQVIRRLDKLREAGNLRDGVKMENGGTLSISTKFYTLKKEDMDLNVPDNRILSAAYFLHERGEDVVFISKDINARIKADALGIPADDFQKEKVNIDEMYSGYSSVDVESELIDRFFNSDVLEGTEIGRFPNEFVTMKDISNRKRSALAKVLTPGTLTHLSKRHESIWNILARNKEQRMAMDLLMDPDVEIVTLVGQAGTGKTLIALAAAMDLTIKQNKYDRILVSRPIIPLGKDIGYLPGNKDEKMAHWMQPIFDNMTFLLREPESDPTDKKTKRSKNTPQDKMEKLFSDSVVILEALTYIRGRSIPNQYVIVDEAQNLTPHEVKTIISRAGEGTKIVLTGDPYQIDNPYLDASSNGLTYAAERLKSHPIHGHVTLRTSERSHLAGIAAELL